MSDLIQQIQAAQIRAGEDVVMRHLEQQGLASSEDRTRQEMHNRTVSAGRLLQAVCHDASLSAGWWHTLDTDEDLREQCIAGSRLGKALVGQKLMLIVSEVSEAMEGHRKGLPDDKLPHRLMLEVELADAVIRIADLAGALGLDLGGAIAEKLAYNAQRADHKPENRKAEGGKAY